MKILKSRTVLGVICIVVSLLICFGVTPLFNKEISKKVEIVRVVKNIKIGDKITGDMVRTVEVGSLNLPPEVMKNKDNVIGKYASADMVAGDYIINSKVADEPAAENAYLYRLSGEKQAISVLVKSFATGLSGKLKSGDIVSVIAPDYQKHGDTVIPPELKYVEVIAVTAGSGYDANTVEEEESEEKELPSTVTLLATPEQSRILAMMEKDGNLHIALVYRGTKENAAKFIAEQDQALQELYPPEAKSAEAETGQPEGETEGSAE